MRHAIVGSAAEGNGLNELLVRTLTGVLLIAAALFAAVQGGNVLALMVAAVATLMFYEWTRIVKGWGPLWYVSGFVYALLPALALLWIRERTPPDMPSNEFGLALLVWVFIVTWATDIGAYFAGRAIGGPKLAPSISPKKTIAGLVGGIICATILAGVWMGFVNWDRSLRLPAVFVWLAAPFACAAQAGDLFESWMKRKAGVKDSGAWLPGHGGVLDRLDGLVPVAVLTAAAQLLGWP
jgi:phosphatidate cytidylyltransferase